MDILVKAREAVASRDWATAFAAFSAVHADSLAPDDLDSLAQAAWWLGEMDASIAAHERAYELYLADGSTDGAVMSALYLSYDHFNRRDGCVHFSEPRGSLARLASRGKSQMRPRQATWALSTVQKRIRQATSRGA